MDKRDKNIEDFFNKSLEQFSDVPSNAVWEGIAEKLGEVQLPFYKRWRFWGGIFIAMVLLSLLTYGYATTQKAINLLTLRTDQLVQENQELKLALNDCSMESANLLSGREKFKPHPITTEQNDFTKNENDDLEDAKKSKKRPFFRPKENLVFANFNKIDPFYLSKEIDFSSAILAKDGYSLALNRAAAQKVTFSNGIFFLTDEIPTGKKEVLPVEKEIEIPLSTKVIADAKNNGFHHLAKLGTLELEGRHLKANFRRRLPNYFKDYSELNLIQPIKPKLDFRLGWSFGGMNTFTDQKDLFGPGYNSGLTSELRLFDKVYLTAALQYNEQRYEVKLTADNQNVLQSYPDVDELTSVVTSINQHVHYLDLPIGLKWYFKENDNGIKFYINPAVAWQFYFPQQFEYEQATNNGIITKAYTNQQFFGYFGTAQMQIGLEKSLFKKMHYQVGLWGEKSFIPLGVENRNLFNVGIRGAIFFN